MLGKARATDLEDEAKFQAWYDKEEAKRRTQRNGCWFWVLFILFFWWLW
tara:strand:- start:559 stop:705 length:147 start_codon:yes stop_codon:yes gene_type:complete